MFFAQLRNNLADEILADCLDQLDKSGIDQNADAEWESGRRAKVVNDQVMMRRALERRANRRGRVKGVKTFNEDYDLFNYQSGRPRDVLFNGGPFVHHFTREATTREATRKATRSSLAGRDNLNERQVIIERRERVKAATLYVLRRFANQTLPRPPDPQAKCYLSGADDIRPALFRALPC